MGRSKKYLFYLFLLLMVLGSAILCGYALQNYRGTERAPIGNEGRSFSGPGRNGDPGGNQLPAERNGRQQGEFRGGGQLREVQPGNRNSGGPTQPPGRGPNRGNVGTGSSYALALNTYAVIFFSLFAAVYFIFKHRKLKTHPASGRLLILTLLGVGLLLRIASATLMEGHPYDMGLFKSWATTAAGNLFQVYSSGTASDYPPLYMYVLYVIGKLAGIPALSGYFSILVKLPSMLADIAVSLLLYRLAKKHLSAGAGVLVSAFYLFNPAVLINSAFWGQVDSFFTLLVVGALYLLSSKKLAFASALFTAAVLMKPQGIIFLPVLFFELVRQKSLKAFVKAGISVLVTALAVVLPFALKEGPLWIFNLFFGTIGEYPYASVNAFNFFSLLGGNYTRDSATLFLFSYHTWGMAFIVIATVFSWWIYARGKDSRYAFAAALFLIAGVFTFSARMHERYLFPAAALAVMAFLHLRDKRFLLLAAGFSGTIYANTQAVLFGALGGSRTMSPVMVITSVCNILLAVYLGKVLFDIAVRKKPRLFG